jgi:hypothetical protein
MHILDFLLLQGGNTLNLALAVSKRAVGEGCETG